MILTKIKIVDMREYSLDQVNIPRMYFQEQPPDFKNKREYLSEEFKEILQQEQEVDKIQSNNAGPAPKRFAQNEMPTREATKRLRNA